MRPTPDASERRNAPTGGSKGAASGAAPDDDDLEDASETIPGLFRASNGGLQVSNSDNLVQKEIDSLIVGIEEGAERTAEIVQGLRTFSRIDEAELKTVNIHDGILSTLVILKNSTPYYINIEKEFNAQGEVECYPGKLNQVFMNIITNAIQAITAKPEKSNPETITISTKDVEKDCIRISIKDTGIGMNEEVKHRIFEPFFTTKDVGEGTGLGMAIVFKIIQKHEGHVDIISEPCKGSEFIITLPYKHPISDHL